MNGIFQTVITSIFAKADIKINGHRPWDIHVINPKFYHEVLKRGSLGLGESYMQGWWTCRRVDEFICRLLASGNEKWGGLNLVAILNFLKCRFSNMVTVQKAFRVGEVHYDLGNDLFEKMLDSRMVYTCAYWDEKQELTLELAQEAKFELICRKLKLKPGNKILDIGCGWGGFLKYAAENYGTSGVGITISKEQAKLARENCAGLPIEIRIQDYREVTEKFNHIISIGMFEHVGVKNYATYFEAVRDCLKPNGLFLLHTIGKEGKGIGTDPWLDRYIFPHGKIPSKNEIEAQSQGIIKILDWHCLGGWRYDKTLLHWYENFSNSWEELEKNYTQAVNGRFKKMWEYYLLSCAGAFRSGKLDVWQIVMSKNEIPYESIR